MEEEPIYTEGKYALFAERDDDGLDPYKFCDFEPPMMSFSCGRHYESIKRERYFYASDIIGMLKPEHCDTREKRESLIEIWEWGCKALSYQNALRAIINEGYSDGKIETSFCDWISDKTFYEPSSWRDCIDFFDRLEALCAIVGVACIYEQSNGYSQGDCVLVFMAATPDWLKETGLSGETLEGLKANLMSSYKQYSAWMWGDCYGWVVKEIIVDDDGNKSYGDTIDSCWGYYTDDHDWNGLFEAGKDHVQYLIRSDKKEEAASFEAACRDIVTI